MTVIAKNVVLHWRVLIFAVLLVVFAWVIYGARLHLAGWILPWLRLVCSLLEPVYDIAEFNIQQNKHELVFHLRLLSEGALDLYGHHLPRLDVSATTLVTHYLQHLFVFGAVFLSGVCWISVTWLKFIPMLAATFLLSVGLDIPLTLLGSIDGLILQNLAPDQLDGSPWVMMERVMNNGGRMGLALGLSLFSLMFAVVQSDRRLWLLRPE